MRSLIQNIFMNRGSDNLSGPPQIHVGYSDEDPEIYKKKLKNLLDYEKEMHAQKRRNSFHASMSRLFNVLLFFVCITFSWALYIYGFSDDARLIQKADFIFSTLTSALVASVIGMVATVPRE